MNDKSATKGLFRWLLLSLLLLILNGCATTGEKSRLWSAETVVSAGKAEHGVSPENVSLLLPDRTIAGSVNRIFTNKLLETTARIDAVASTKTKLYLTNRGHPKPNAFSTIIEGKHIVAINLRMIALLGSDQSTYATLIGHEIAHYLKGHHAASKERIEKLRASAAASISLGPAGVPVVMAASIIDSNFSREQELEADAKGIELMHKAGFPLSGAIFFYEKLATAHPKSSNPLSSHPGMKTRLLHIRKWIAELSQRL